MRDRTIDTNGGVIDVAAGGYVDWRSSVPSEGRIFRAPPTTTGA